MLELEVQRLKLLGSSDCEYFAEATWLLTRVLGLKQLVLRSVYYGKALWPKAIVKHLKGNLTSLTLQGKLLLWVCSNRAESCTVTACNCNSAMAQSPKHNSLRA